MVGAVGIMDVLLALLLSRVEPKTCPGHHASRQIVNVKASLWAQTLTPNRRTDIIPYLCQSVEITVGPSFLHVRL